MAAFEPTVAVICPLPIELRAVLAVFNDPPQLEYGSERKFYYSGIIGKHSTVAICLPEQEVGVVQASRCGDWLQREFPSLQHRFLVGVGGGIPDKIIDIRLGDIVIGTHVCKYDSGKWVRGELQVRPALKEAPQELREAIPMFKALSQQDQSQLLEDELVKMRKLGSINDNPWIYPDPENVQDVLFKQGYACSSPSQEPCSCDQSNTVERGDRQSKSPKVHYGLIASGDQVMKDDKRRDKLKDDFRNIFRMDVLAVEMEAAGLADLGYMVFRGICDYADSHKNKKWQEYAAGTAAACFKTFLDRLHPPDSNSSNDDPSSRNNSSYGPRSRLPSAVSQMSFTDSERGTTDLRNRLPKSFAEGSTTKSSMLSDNPLSHTVTYSHNAEGRGRGRGRGSGQAGQPLRQLSPAPTSSPENNDQQDLTAYSAIPSQEVWHSPNYTPASTNSSFSRDSRDPSPHSTALDTTTTKTTAEIKSTNPALNSHTWEWRLREWCLRESSRNSKREDQVKSSKGEAAELQLFQEDIPDEPLKTRRSIEICSATQSADPFVSWIPLDGLQVRVQRDRVYLQYSNCNAQQWNTVNGIGQYRSIYNDKRPNLSADFVFVDSESAKEFASLILHADCVLPGYHHLKEFQTISGICRIGIASEMVNQSSTTDQAQQGANIIINIDNNKDIDNNDIRISSVFSLGSCFEYDFQAIEGAMTISLGHLRKALYKTPTKVSRDWPPHWVCDNRHGSPDEIDYENSKSLVVSFSKQCRDGANWKAFMMTITGWQIHSWQDIQMDRRDAQIGVWLRESSLKLLCKVRVSEGELKWYCLDLSRNHVEQGSLDIDYGLLSKTSLILKQVFCSKGKHINRSMTIQPACDPRQIKTSDKTLKFTDKGKAQGFETQIKELLTRFNPRFLPKFPLVRRRLMKLGESKCLSIGKLSSIIKLAQNVQRSCFDDTGATLQRHALFSRVSLFDTLLSTMGLSKYFEVTSSRKPLELSLPASMHIGFYP